MGAHAEDYRYSEKTNTLGFVAVGEVGYIVAPALSRYRGERRAPPRRGCLMKKTTHVS